MCNPLNNCLSNCIGRIIFLIILIALIIYLLWVYPPWFQKIAETVSNLFHSLK